MNICVTYLGGVSCLYQEIKYLVSEIDLFRCGLLTHILTVSNIPYEPLAETLNLWSGAEEVGDVRTG